MKIHFGCGAHKFEGWINHDIDVDLKYRLPYDPDCADMVYCSHVAEHLNSHDAMGFFSEVHRILKPGGVFRVVVPTLEKITDRIHALDLVYGHGHAMVFSKESLRDMLWAAGFERDRIVFTAKDLSLDWHGRTIGEEKDNQESCWVNAQKLDIT